MENVLLIMAFDALPSNGQFGSNGTKLIFKTGTAVTTPFALGTDGGALWYGVPATASHNFFTGTNRSLMIDPSQD